MATFLASFLLPRLLAFYLGRQMMTGGDPQRISHGDDLWQYPGFRFGNRVVSAVWGWGLLIEAGLRIVLALGLPVSLFLLAWPYLNYGIYEALLVWTVYYWCVQIALWDGRSCCSDTPPTLSEHARMITQ